MPAPCGAEQSAGLSQVAAYLRRLTFDMSGEPKGAKRALARPLDGGVRFRVHGEGGCDSKLIEDCLAARPEFFFGDQLFLPKLLQLTQPISNEGTGGCLTRCRQSL